MTLTPALVGDLGRLAGLLARGDRADVQTARLVVQAIRRALSGSAHRNGVDPGEQLALSLRYQADSLVDCPLGCQVRAVVCVGRQIASEMEVGPAARRTKSDPGYGSRTKRGRLASFVQCRTELCATGALVRIGLGDTPQAVALARSAPRSSDTSNG